MKQNIIKIVFGSLFFLSSHVYALVESIGDSTKDEGSYVQFHIQKGALVGSVGDSTKDEGSYVQFYIREGQDKYRINVRVRVEPDSTNKDILPEFINFSIPMFIYSQLFLSEVVPVRAIEKFPHILRHMIYDGSYTAYHIHKSMNIEIHDFDKDDLKTTIGNRITIVFFKDKKTKAIRSATIIIYHYQRNDSFFNPSPWGMEEVGKRLVAGLKISPQVQVYDAQDVPMGSLCDMTNLEKASSEPSLSNLTEAIEESQTTCSVAQTSIMDN